MTDKDPIEQKVVTELRDLMGDAYLTVYEAFLRSVEQNITELVVAVSSNKLDEIQSITHTLKGSSANVGAKHLSEISKRMMEDARNGVAADYQSHLGHLQQESARVIDYIGTFFEK